MSTAAASTPSAASALDPHLIAALIQSLGDGQVLQDDTVRNAHAGDWSEAPHVTPPLVIAPRTPQQVADALAICSRFGQSVAIQGGLTGLAGGATPIAGDIALSLHRLDTIENLDLVGGTVTVQAGVILENLQNAVQAQGWLFPLDLGARGSCQVGGNAATNAGGNRVIRYGTMRELVLGLEVALPNGELLTMMNQVTKNTSGIDLKHLFIGAEGTLGVITRLVLQLAPLPSASATALCALPSFEAATRLLHTARRALPSLSAFEVMWAGFVQASMAVANLRPPFDDAHPVYVLIETLGTDEGRERELLEQVLSDALDDGTLQDGVVAQSLDEVRRLWSYRESVAEMLQRYQPVAAFDVGIPMAAMDTFVQQVQDTLQARYPEQHHLCFGHIGDGNLHVISGPHATEAQLLEVEGIVYDITRSVQGTISAEHGIGVIKRPFLGHTRSAAEIDIMRNLKALFDPAGILNPGRIFTPAA